MDLLYLTFLNHKTPNRIMPKQALMEPFEDYLVHPLLKGLPNGLCTSKLGMLSEPSTLLAPHGPADIEE